MTYQSGTYTLDAAHSSIGFSVRHAMVTKVHGRFEEFEATIEFDAENPANSSTTATIKTDSINTNNSDRDEHLRNKDFFNAEENPSITFKSTAIELHSEEKATVKGDLTIKGITKLVSLDVDLFGSAEDPWGQTRVGFEATTTINRNDFGVEYNAPLKTGGVLIGNDIAIQIEGSAVKQ